MSIPDEPLLDVRNLKTWFFTQAGIVKAVDDVDLSVRKGEILGLVGESGSGKSITGFSIIGLIDPPGRIVEGSIRFAGKDLAQASEAELEGLRGVRIAMIFQDPMMTLNPVLRIDTQMVETIAAHEPGTSRAEALERSRQALEKVGIASAEERLKTYPHQLSGGMRQRVAIAIALLHEPDLIIADEPTTALDVTIQAQILFEIQNLCEATGTALIWISHDLAIVSGLADRIAVMYAGRIVETGTTEQVIGNPAHPYTKGLLDSVPSQTVRGQRLNQIRGMAPSVIDLPEACAFAPRCAFVQERCRNERPATRDLGGGRKLRCHFPLHVLDGAA